MKRDWDFVRELLTDIEGDKDIFAGFPDEPKWGDFNESEFQRQLSEYRTLERRFFGHLELLVDNGYVEGIDLMRSADGHFAYGLSDPRLTMAGHDLLDTMRSKTVWEKVKSTAKSKGIELTLDSIKALAAWTLKSLLE